MEKFINVKSGKEVKVGDLIKVVTNVNLPVFGEIKAVKEITLTKDMLTKLILRGEVKIIKLDKDEVQVADVDRNGYVDLKDAQIILKYALKIISSFDE